MELLVLVDADIHFTALARARAVAMPASPSTDGLAGLSDDDTRSWATRIMDNVEQALTAAYQHGLEAARPLLDTVFAYLDELGTTTKKRARDVHDIIRKYLHEYLRDEIDRSLERVRSTITVGGLELKMKSVAIEQKVKLSGNIKASLAELCSFVAEGELTLKAEYVTD